MLATALLGRIKLVVGIKIQRSSDKLEVTGLKVFFWEPTMVETDVAEGFLSHLIDKVVYQDSKSGRECTPSVGLQSLYCFFSQSLDGSTASIGVTTFRSRRMIETWKAGDLLEAAQYVDEHAENDHWKVKYANKLNVVHKEKIQKLVEIRNKYCREEDEVDEANKKFKRKHT
ncbi:hypothetical protein ARMGADRAFT_1037235 [Armillaria gallica]|uniref:Uncharacterized protein n=1 Tax=Armillaria gallica TaxID=47427 RepID=A0A2H3D0L7_ARMGA|nr:hypothetical protein ARMGADRAFT_1037235 [Armillaria gallica]